ncbi:ribonuclease Z [Ruminococcus flavefaciens]|uniref:ribonuclease Z n=1 Tax=Ruminococcus flavefaciens TaxID=1265 RepID=UPI0004677F5A|nr:ribonuclease Z [Ruminococcus flavefaciens]
MPDICLLGTGGMLPLKDRFLTSLYAEYNGKAVLIDCGEGTQVAIAKHGLKMSKIELLLITHCHADHVTGLPGLLLSIGNSSRTEPLDIAAPESCLSVIGSLMSVCGALPYEVRLHGLPEDKPYEFAAEMIDPMLKIRTLPLSHRVSCLGYSLSLERKPEFQPQNAKALGIPVEYWKRLHAGETVTLSDGRSIAPEAVTGEKRPPIKITYTTDTLPIAELKDLAESSDLFICEGMYGSSDKKESMNEKCHMLMQDACSIAAAANVKRLWLTHYSPAEKEPSVYEEELREIFPQVTVTEDGAKITL